MKIELDLRKSPQQNAAEYYEKAKKLRAKLARLLVEIEKTKRMIEEEKKKAAFAVPKLPEKKIVREKEWFEKFHWSRSPSGLLIVGGRDTKSNDIIVKKHLEAGDLFFHADVTGASAVVLKDGAKASVEDKKAAAGLAACFSRAWQAGLAAVDVYAVPAAQVKLAAKSGEYLTKGSFVIEGKREWFRNAPLELAVDVEGGTVTVFPTFVNKKGVHLKPDARGSKGDAAKLVLLKLKQLFPEAATTLDDVLAALPNGGSRVAG
ncbi:DUF814 domain-containing protein [archaeon]|nr:DUF814 domain-containing protein [archaeon]